MKLSLRGIMLAGMFLAFLSQGHTQTEGIGQKTRLTHEMTADEYARRHEIGRNFVQTDPPTGEITNIAEFDRAGGSVIAWSYDFGIPMSVIRELAKDDKLTILVPNASSENNVRNQLTAARVNMSNCSFMYIPTDSYWARDFGPWYVAYGDNQIGIIDFPYNRPRPNDDEAPKIMATNLGLQWFGMPVIHTGGNYMTDGYGFSASTDIAYTENPGVTPTEINQRMSNYLGVDDYSVLDDPNNTYIDHIDCWGKYLAPDKVLIRSVPTSHPQYDEIEATAAYFQNKNSIYGTPYRVYRVYTPQDQPYTNSYILNGKVFVPIMQSSNDAAALQAYRDALPGFKVFGFIGKYDTPWESTDALHCRVHEMADVNMIFIKHIPFSGIQPVNNTFTINAKINAFSGETLVSDSVLLYYRINPTPNTIFSAVTMNNVSGNEYSAAITVPVPGSRVEYYIFAKDASGKKETHPLIGRADPHVFYVGSEGVATQQINPQSLYFTAMKDTEDAKSFTINNTGDFELTWSLSISTTANDTLTYSLPNSPAATSWDNNTLTENSWTSFTIDENALVDNVVLSFTWTTDEYYSEGSIWIESPTGTKYLAGKDNLSGTYKVNCHDFTGEQANGTWKVWLEDTYGDGGHQATNVTVKFVKQSITNWLNADINEGSVVGGSNAEINITADAHNLPIGHYAGSIAIYTNSEEAPVTIIPVAFEVTLNTAAGNTEMSNVTEVNPNPFVDEITVTLNNQKTGNITLELYNAEGKLIFNSTRNVERGLQNIKLPANDLTGGTYLLKVINGNAGETFKLIKK